MIRIVQYLFLFTFCICFSTLRAQRILLPEDEKKHQFASDSIQTDNVPEGIYVWHIDPRFGTRSFVPVDTASYLFPNKAYTDGLHGTYNYLGNLASPRISREFWRQGFDTFERGQFIFSQPYSYFLRQPQQVYFTNTKSPFTNLTYHECGNKQEGEDHFSAAFAVNVNKQAGFGATVDYDYGRGYYANNSTADLNATFYGSYISDHYALNAFYSNNHIKTRENGGLENDDYITRPETFPTRFQPRDIPTRLERVYNKMHVNTFFLTHRYNFGLQRYRDAKGRIVRLKNDTLVASNPLVSLTDSAAQHQALSTNNVIDTAQTHEQLTAEFIPVLGIVHTLRWDKNERNFLNNDGRQRSEQFFQHFYLPGNKTDEEMRYTHIGNLLGLEISEGFAKWVKTGMRLFAKYDYFHYTLPELPAKSNPDIIPTGRYNDHYVSLGAEFFKQQGKIFRFNALGEIRSNGQNWGEFNLQSHFAFDIPLTRHDSLQLRLEAKARNEQPDFYLRHFHSMNAWWDNDLDNTLSTELQANLRYKNSALTATWKNIKNYVYLSSDAEMQNEHLRYAAAVNQKAGAISLFRLTAQQDLHLGPWNWENYVTLQKSSDTETLPLPLINLWSNMYFKFRIAKVLNTEVGADVRYFTKYYAPSYLPMTGLFGVQKGDGMQKVGGYPIINAYVNFDLKRTRFYVAVSHINAREGKGEPFLLPHYPINGRTIRLGISWNFIN